MKKAQEYKESGNKHFQQKLYKEAIIKYEKAIVELKSSRSSNGKSTKKTQEWIEFKAAVHSNLSLTYSKIRKYKEAEEENKNALQLHTQLQTPNKYMMAKIYYRRCNLRERQKDIEGAFRDVCQGLELLEALDEYKTEVQDLQKTKARLSSLIPSKPQHPQPHLTKLIGKRDQREIISRLLSQSTQIRKPGEAYYLIPTKWFNSFRQYVEFNPSDATLSSYFRGNAIFRDEKKSDSYSDSDSDSDCDSESTPGPINTENLLLNDTYAFHRQWLIPHYEDLLPNLVRSYHYEIIPREVFAALTSWYPLHSKPILRRTVGPNATISLYTIKSHIPSQKNTCHACQASARMRCMSCQNAYYCNEKCQESDWEFHKSNCKTKASAKRRRGICGLVNLGNTCFMNSALQCLASTTPLTRYFLSNEFRDNINSNNPLASPGNRLAFSYSKLLRDLYLEHASSSSSSSSVNPSLFKNSISTFAPRFSGYQQHDAQEFLAYLLDGLHEDLNRILGPRRYVEHSTVEYKPEQKIPNLKLAGAKSWDDYKMRNDSLIFDTFYGQFKSTCQCPSCHKVSISFDVFNHLSLEIPSTQKLREVGIWAIPPNEYKASLISFSVPWNATVLEIKKQLLDKFPTTMTDKQWVICDVINHSVHDILLDSKSLELYYDDDATTLVAFFVDSYEVDTTIHAIITHSIETKRFGCPIFISFSSTWTCAQLWTFLSKHVEHFILHEKDPTQLIQIQVVDQQGNERIFQGSNVHDNSSTLNPQSNQTVADLLGAECTETFLFLSILWNSPCATLLQSLDFMRPKPQLQQQLHNNSKVTTLQQCLNHFTKPEKLDETNQWYCSDCQNHVQALKTMELWRLPNILVLHLKRFEYSSHSNALFTSRREKLETLVHFPIEDLDMNPFCCYSNEHEEDSFLQNVIIPAHYDLYAVVNHYGRMGFGHYTAYARKWNEQGLSKDWFLYDDSIVRPLENANDLITPAAYVLFYRRRIFT